MKDSNAIVVFITTASRDEAQSISNILIEKRQVACVNIVPQVDSVFWWEGRVESEQECLLIAKTKTSVLNSVIDIVKQVHSYDVPEVIALPIVGGNGDYLNWINEEISE
ncbi:MAG: divalent-cation tolerance protein CutA [Chloroflexota bacterium]|nr:divalent-cation tolerance protein CutA [Chloroflexota bacterium]